MPEKLPEAALAKKSTKKMEKPSEREPVRRRQSPDLTTKRTDFGEDTLGSD